MSEDVLRGDQLIELPPVAKVVLLQCKKCDGEKFHVVLAHTNSKSAKVQCEICKSKKTFKLKAAKKEKAPKPKKAFKFSTKKNADAPTWMDLKVKIGEENVQSYSMKNSFKKDTAISHPKFGVGFVTLSGNGKIDVVFQTGLKSLVHNRA